MNIKIVDSWLRDYLDTKATPGEIAKYLSLTSVSVDKIEKIPNDFVYDIEITTNRVDLMSVTGIAKEATTILPEHGISAKFKPLNTSKNPDASISFPIEIKNNPKLVNRLMAVVMEVKMDESPNFVKKRLEASGIRSLNNIIDVTNYVMREIGHPAHVFDYDHLNTKKLIIRESKKGEELVTLDNKKYSLYGGDIIADDGRGTIVDLLGVMGTKNSVVGKDTKRILYFLDNNNPAKIRKTSMTLGIRTEAAIINEKDLDPNLAEIAFLRGIDLFKKNARAKVISKTIDIYPNKPKINKIIVSGKKISRIIGVEISPQRSKEILERLGFEISLKKDILEVATPSIRPDVLIEEDVIEEIARIYGYHKLPSKIPTFLIQKPSIFTDNFYFEEKIKTAMKYWGYDETYTYSLISEQQFDGSIKNAVKLKNPLTDDMVYMRNSLVPSLLSVVEENKDRGEIKIFEMSSIYQKRGKDLPKETLMLSGILKKGNASFFEIKGLVEEIIKELGIKNLKFQSREDSPGANIILNKKRVGYIEILDTNLIDFELNFEELLSIANNKKTYKPLAKYPAIYEDITFELPETVLTEEVINEIQIQNFLIRAVILKDEYQNPASPEGRSKTFHIEYRAEDRNLTDKEVAEIRKEITDKITKKFQARVK